MRGARQRSGGRALAVAALAALAGCAALEGLGKFSAVDADPALPPASADASQDDGGSAAPLDDAGGPGAAEGGGDAPVDAVGPDAPLIDVLDAGVDLALGASVTATVSADGNPPTHVVDGDLQTTWRSGHATCHLLGSNYTCGAVSVTITLAAPATVDRVVVVSVGGEHLLTAMIVLGDGGDPIEQQAMFVGDTADVTFPPVANVVTVQITLETANGPDPVLNEVMVYGP